MRIGVFDSGIGGLTVLRALQAAWPGHSTLYLGDTARVPYGSKSPETVARYARQNAMFLLEQGIELLVIACNTASAYAVEELSATLPIPVVGVIEPGAAAVSDYLAALPVERAAQAVVGVIGTGGMIASGAYERALHAHRPGLKILTRACPLFVPLVEDGWESSPVARTVAETYLHDWLPLPDACSQARVPVPEAIVLGCTHYPVLRPMLSALFGPCVTLIDSAETTARALAPYLAHAPREAVPQRRLIVTDGAPGFAIIASRLLDHMPLELEIADIGTVVA